MTKRKRPPDRNRGGRKTKSSGRLRHKYSTVEAWVSLDDVCRRYWVTRATVEAWCRCRFFPPPIELAGRLWWDQRDLDLHDRLCWLGGAEPSPHKCEMFERLYRMAQR